MLRSRLFTFALLAGFAIPAVSYADVSLGTSGNRNFVVNKRPSKKNGRLTPVSESSKWRKGYGAYSGRGRREAAELQRGDQGMDALEASIGTSKDGAVIDRTTELADDALSGCGGGYKVLAGEVAAEAGIKKGDGKSKLSNLSCNVGVEGTLAGAEVDCVKVLSGDRNNGVLVRGGAQAGAGASLGCSCEGAGVVCEAFIGVKGAIDGGIGGTLCGVGMVLNGGLEGGAGAGAKAQVGYVKGKGYGLALAGYVGLGGGAKVYVDPKLDGLLQGSTYKCLGDKALGAIKGAGGAIADGVRGAWNRLGGLFGGGGSSGSGSNGGGGSTVHRVLTK